MSAQIEKIALFIDGANLYATAKSLGFDIDYKRLLREFQSRGYLVRAFYYTAVIEDQEYSSIRPLIDWLDYNGYTVVTKATKEFVDQTGRRKVKGNMDIELAVDAMEIAPHIDQMVLFSGDGDFRSLVEAVQRRGVRVIVVSTISTQPPMVADELRRQADQFVDIVELQPKIGRDPVASGRRASRENRASRARAAPHAAIPAAQPDLAARRSRGRRVRRRLDRPRIDAMTRPSGMPGRDCPRCPRLVAFRETWREREPDWFNAPVDSFGPTDARLLIVGLAPGLRGANRTGRPFTGDYAGDLLYATLQEFGFARGDYQAQRRRRARTRRLPHHQRGALRAAGEQADAAGDHDLPRFPRRDDRGNAASCAPSSRWAASRMRHSSSRSGARRSAVPVRPWPRARARRAHACSTAITARATTRIPAC